jgi:hypothetical protein
MLPRESLVAVSDESASSLGGGVGGTNVVTSMVTSVVPCAAGVSTNEPLRETCWICESGVPGGGGGFGEALPLPPYSDFRLQSTANWKSPECERASGGWMGRGLSGGLAWVGYGLGLDVPKLSRRPPPPLLDGKRASAAASVLVTDWKRIRVGAPGAEASSCVVLSWISKCLSPEFT